MIKTIKSPHNDAVKLIRRLRKKNVRKERGLFVAEGFDLLESALKVEEFPMLVLVRDDLVGRLSVELREAAEEDELDIGVCPSEVLEHASSLGGAADVVIVYLHAVGDPGNVGTIVRGVVAFGGDGVICGPGTADPYSPKALRAGMGAQFLTRVVVDVPPGDLEAKLRAGVARGDPEPRVVLADPRAEEPAEALEAMTGGVVLVLGSERGELPDLAPTARRVAIRQARFDSLNVGMAATVLLYELSRGRLGKDGRGLLA